ncbi:MAG: hypothetical protein AAB460_00065 [Patescibacteria group bacterium]
MFDLIAKLQQKPEPERRRIAFLVSLVVTGIIVAIWLISLSVRFGSPSKKTEEPSLDKSAPFSALGEQFKSTLDSFQNLFKN